MCRPTLRVVKGREYRITVRETSVGYYPIFLFICSMDGLEGRSGQAACYACYLDGRTHTSRIFNAVDDLMIRATTPILDLFGAGVISFCILSQSSIFLVLFFLFLSCCQKDTPSSLRTLSVVLLQPKVIYTCYITYIHTTYIHYLGSTLHTLLVYSLLLGSHNWVWVIHTSTLPTNLSLLPLIVQLSLCPLHRIYSML